VLRRCLEWGQWAKSMIAKQNRKRNIPAAEKLGVRRMSQIRVKFVIIDTTVEHVVIQNASPYEKPLSTGCLVPNTITVTIFSISEDAELYYAEAHQKENSPCRESATIQIMVLLLTDLSRNRLMRAMFAITANAIEKAKETVNIAEFLLV
jgi:hypothetical protein